MSIVANSMRFPAMQKLGKLVKISQSYGESLKGGTFLRHSVDVATLNSMILRTQLFTGAYLLIALTRKKHHCTGLVCQNFKKTIIIKQFEIDKMLV